MIVGGLPEKFYNRFSAATYAWIVLASETTRIGAADQDSVPGGWVNTHYGPLPHYGGLDAPFWCFYHREPQLAVTLHYMDKKFDTGPINAQEFIANEGQGYFKTVDALFDLAFDAHTAFAAEFSPGRAETRR